MNCNEEEAKNLAREISVGLRSSNLGDLEIVLCPPFTALKTVYEEIKNNETKIKIGAQNCHFLPCGAFTGEISPIMLKDFCQYVIVGHS